MTMLKGDVRAAFGCFAKTMTCALALMAGSVEAAVDQPDALTFVGTGYHTNDWFSFATTLHSDGDGVLLDNMSEFVLSPRYAAPIRKVILRVKASAPAPSRYLRVRPFVDGLEVGTNVFDCAARSVADTRTFESVSFDYPSDARVDAVRIGLDGSGTGNWRIASLVVFFGEKGADEDEILRSFAQELPPPGHPRVASFGLTSLSLAADAVADAASYRFSVVRVDGTPLTTVVENFAAAPALTASGWTISSENANLTEDTGSTYPDAKTASDGKALKVDKPKTVSSGAVWVEVVSAEVSDSISEASFVAKAGTTGRSDRISVYGRTDVASDWTLVGSPFAVTATKSWVTNAVPVEAGYRQVKFRFEAEADNFTPCGLDTLRVVYGGNETRTPVAVDESYATPACDLTGLATARYLFQAQAVGGADYRDSSWTEPQLVDLNWVGVTVSAPDGVALSASGSTLTVSWNPVAGAESYLVTVVPVDDPYAPVVVDAQTTATSLSVTLPAVGLYAATVTASSPLGLSTATAPARTLDVSLGALGPVAAEATDPQTIAATWKAVPLAESYQATLVRLGGSAETLSLGWELDGSRISLPPDWSAEAEWTGAQWTSGAAAYPSLDYTDCWIASGAGEEPITRLVCQYKCGSSAAAILEHTRFAVYVADTSGDWEQAARVATQTSLKELALDFPASRDVRQVKLVAESESKQTLGNVRLGRLALTRGVETRTAVASQRVVEGAATFRGLDPSERYQVVVSPQPSEDAALAAASATVDLSATTFRQTGAVSIASLRGGVYEQDFSVLTNVSADVETKSLALDFWQFLKGSGDVETLLYTSSTNRTNGGVYAFGSDGDASARCIGTLATSSMGCSVGLAFRNDETYPVGVASVSFMAVQRSCRANPATYAVEWLVTDGAGAIGADGDWQLLSTPATAPYTSAAPFPGSDYRQTVELTEALPNEKIPVGGVLLLRWRHAKGASGPMMAIDDVRVAFETVAAGGRVVVK